jgi:hypothetical protein
MELNELHIHQRRSGMIRKRVTVACVLPTITGDLVGSADAAGRKYNGIRVEYLEPASLALVGKRPRNAIPILEERNDCTLHVNVNALMNAMILKGPDHLETGAIAHMGQPGIFVPAEIALQNAAILGAIEEGSPSFQLTNAIGRFLRMQLRHSGVVQVLTTAHGIGEMDPPTIAVVDVGESGSYTAFGHDSVSLPQERL